MSEGLYFDQSKDWSLQSLDIDKLPKGKISYGSFNIFSDAAHRLTNVPVIAVIGEKNGPTLGLTAVVHGNELNGIMTIHQLIERIDPKELRGNIIAIPVVNMYGYLTQRRNFIDNNDLNRSLPGKKNGKPSKMFTFRLMKRIISKFDYLIDIHTASFGRVNSHYIRANLKLPTVRRMAELQDASLIVHTTKPRGSFRQEATRIGIPAITIELGNPQKFQQKMIGYGVDGIKNVMIDFDMINGKILDKKNAIVCKKSYWLRVDQGGVLHVYPELLELTKKDQEIAKLTDIFGREVCRFQSPENGIVIGKSTNPVTFTGGRIIHLGIPSSINEIIED